MSPNQYVPRMEVDYRVRLWRWKPWQCERPAPFNLRNVYLQQCVHGLHSINFRVILVSIQWDQSERPRTISRVLKTCRENASHVATLSSAFRILSFFLNDDGFVPIPPTRGGYVPVRTRQRPRPQLAPNLMASRRES